MKCPKCGASVPDGNVFCNECGSKIDLPADVRIPNEPEASAEAIVETTEGSYSFGEPVPSAEGSAAQIATAVFIGGEAMQETQEEPVSGTYTAIVSPVFGAHQAFAPDEAHIAGTNAEGSYSPPPFEQPQSGSKQAKVKKEKPPKPPKAPSDRQFSSGGPAKINKLSAIIMSVLGAALIGVSVWLVLTLSDNAKFNDTLAMRDAKIASLQNTVDSQGAQVQADEATIAGLQTTVADLQAGVDAMQDEVSFFETNAVIVPDDGSNLYHAYGCPHCDVSGSFWIFNTAAASYYGFGPCPYCQ